ncbi:MAG: amino acid ABC transporter substrate-binding protein [Gomphosphaeria aponina SAG 52.96 = DSM 107014]|uniref:Amino acid ABC transporter substrate-binding protein n=1 Tax=Gomphosphaeria aponina SAG 52.96 = DSM 107014 TaxID=1521640 RepID=A0A941JNH0_9CHRO|nr:amino acid ABC transporter substrate-binding protein [Gomphosphaeria aponina SAG 52.96 = DSM 107014]
MSPKNEIKTLLISLLITISLLAGGVWWLKETIFANKNSSSTTQTPPEKPPEHESLETRFSAGEKLLISTEGTSAKQGGVNAFAAGDYQKAVTELESSLAGKKNDPEALIYLNNARIGNNKANTIAVIIPLGTNLDGSQEILRGVAQAQNSINQQGGINGVPVKILIANDDNDPEIAKKIALSLVEKPEVLGVIGHWSSDVTLATSSIYEEKKLVAISPISTSVEISSAGDYIFRTVPSDRLVGSVLSRYQINQLKKQKAAIFYHSKSNYSQSLKDQFTTALFGDGGTVTEFDLARPNLNAANDVQQATSQGAEVLILMTTRDTLDQALQIIQVNEGKLPILAGDGAYAPKILQIGRSDAVGMVVAIPWHILAHSQAEFVQTAENLWGGDINWRTAMSYDAMQALITALAKSPNPTRESVQQALASPDFTAPGAAGEIRFLPSGDRNQPIQLVTIKPGDRSGFGYDFVPILSE